MHTKTHSGTFLFLSSIAGTMLVGCVQPRYQYGVQEHVSYERPLHDDETEGDPDNPITYGGQYPRLDRLESTISAPVKFVKNSAPVKFFKSKFPDKKKEAEDKSPEELKDEAIALSHAYLRDNKLHDIHIDVRRYEPREQWERLKANNRISPVSKYTGGALSVIAYSLIPGRLFHNDSYNPYTNTLSLNSTKPIDALYEAASAKEYHRHKQMGLYSLAQYIPVVPLAHSIRVTSDMNTYAHVLELRDLQKELYPYTYSKVAGNAVSEALSLFPVGTGATQVASSFALGFLGDTAGEITGKAIARQKNPSATAEDDSGESVIAPSSGGHTPPELSRGTE